MSPVLKTLSTLKKNGKAHSLIDQGSISSFNFLVVISLSVWLTPANFAAFIAIAAIIALVILISQSMCANPLLVFSSEIDDQHIAQYHQFTVLLSIIISSIASICLFLAAIPLLNAITPAALALAILSGITQALLETLRKIRYARNETYLLLLASPLLPIVFLLSIFFCKTIYELNLETALGAYFTATLLPVLALIRKNPFPKSLSSNTERYYFFLTYFKKHIDYGKWIVFGGIGYWLSMQGYLVYLQNTISDEHLGALRAIQNLHGLMTIYLTIIENSFTPKIATLNINGGHAGLVQGVSILRRSLLKFGSITVFSVSIFSILVVFFVYRQQYSNLCSFMLIFGLQNCLLLWARAYLIPLRVLKQTKVIMASNWAAALATWTTGPLLVYFYGDTGAALPLLISTIFSTAVLFNGIHLSKTQGKNK